MLATFALLMAAAAGPDCGDYDVIPDKPCFWAAHQDGNHSDTSYLIVPYIDRRNGV